LIQAGRLDDADLSCRDLVQRAPQYANAWVRLGLVSSWRGAYAAAEDAFRRVIALQHRMSRGFGASSAPPSTSRAAARKPSSFARQAIKLDPQQRGALVEPGKCPFHRSALVRSCRGVCSSRWPSIRHDPAVWNNFGNAQLKLGQMQAAEASFQRSLALAPGNVGAFVQLCVFYSANWDGAMRLAVLLASVDRSRSAGAASLVRDRQYLGK